MRPVDYQANQEAKRTGKNYNEEAHALKLSKKADYVVDTRVLERRQKKTKNH